MSIPNPSLARFLNEARKHVDSNRSTADGRRGLIAWKKIRQICTELDLPIPYFLVRDSRSATDDRGFYFLPADEDIIKIEGASGYGVKERMKRIDRIAAKAAVKAAAPVEQHAQLLGPDVIVPPVTVSYLPAKDPNFEPFGFYDDLHMILKTRMFFPVFLTGLSGIGKSLMPLQAAANLGVEMIRVNFDVNTDEDDLIGTQVLLDGDVKFRLGPIPIAMLRGIPVLLDEIDLGAAAIMCLQPVLEGGSLYIKKINQVIHPTPGFNIIATGNTKGVGDASGQFAWTNIMNAAMLDRFPMTFEVDFPPPDAEKRILKHYLDEMDLPGAPNTDLFVNRLVAMAESTRTAMKNEERAEVLSTRRLVQIVKAYGIYGDENVAVERCISRFPAEVKIAFMKFWDATADSTDDRTQSSTVGSVKPPAPSW